MLRENSNNLAVLGLVAASLYLASDALALSFVSQSRTVDAMAEVSIDGIGSDLDSDSSSAPGTGAYISGDVIAEADVPEDFAIAVGGQESSILVTPDAIWTEGEGGGASSYDVFDPGFPASFAAAGVLSLFEFVFTVDRPTQATLVYALLAGLGEFGGTTFAPSALLLLEGASSGVIFADGVEDSIADSMDATSSDSVFGLLAPDTYTFTVGAAVEGLGVEDAFGAGFATYAFEFHVPEPSPTSLLLISFTGLLLQSRRRSS